MRAHAHEVFLTYTLCMNRVFIVHGWASSPEDAWFPWLKIELEKNGCLVEVLSLPEPKRPAPDAWIAAIQDAVGTVDVDTYFVSHSLGCRATALFLQSRAEGEVAGGAVFVAGSFLPPKAPHPHPLAEEVRAKWKEHSVEPEGLAAHLKRLIAIYCEDDPWVSFENAAFSKNILGATLIVETGKGHFRGKHDGILELPSARDAVESLMCKD